MTTDIDILPPDPREHGRERIRALAVTENPGNAWEVPFDPRPSRAVFWVRTALQAIACVLFLILIWSLCL